MKLTDNSPDSWYVYIILSDKGTLYTGITTSLERRLNEHKLSKKGAKFFKTCKPLKIVFSEGFSDRSSASKKESLIKSMTKKQKLELILSFEGHND